MGPSGYGIQAPPPACPCCNVGRFGLKIIDLGAGHSSASETLCWKRFRRYLNLLLQIQRKILPGTEKTMKLN